MNRIRTREAIETFLNQASQESPVRHVLVQALKARMEELVLDFAARGKPPSSQSIFPLIKSEVDEIYAELFHHIDKARKIENGALWQQVLSDCEARFSAQVWDPGAHFDRTIREYSRKSSVQKAYVQMCQAVHRIGEALLLRTRGTYLEASHGCYWLSGVSGAVQIYLSHERPRALDDLVQDPTWAQGAGEMDLLEFAREADAALVEPVYRAESRPGLLDALSAFNTLLDQY